MLKQNNTTPTGSYMYNQHIFYKHSIPTGLILKQTIKNIKYLFD